ncbi:Ig-like domain-containing protein [Flavobacterium anhuiense]|uniref:Ig-like domain-containing protein n=1 Tax=Flavobacterium anhuiense TaxID=459526 RepID=UPI002025CEA8|nr:Ig-like domain-containing protein [Flavobacterium anhuiense]URM36159.1 Ig-like domain-containing protein [Flavobacterium anhuiense]
MGETISNTGTNVLSPLTINRTNFPALSVGAVPLKVALGSSSSNNVQGILLATDGLYAWSKVGMVLDASLTGNATFQKLTIGGNGNGLPAGVNPGDVKMMFATYRTLAITTCSGDVWVISQTAAVRGNGAAGNATSWYKVRTSESGNPYLTNVVACRGNNDGLMALKSDGTIYVWGVSVFLGNNTAAANQNYAAPMTLPSGITPKMIGSTGSGTARSHYILATDGNLYALGANANGQLGDWTVSQRLSWIQPRYNSTSGPVMNDIKWFSPQEHDAQYAAVNVLTANNKIFAFGNSNGSLLGLGSGTINNPASPGGLTGSDSILAVETGGHTSMLVKSCETKFGYVGHRISGSMGDGTNNTTNETSYTFATANVQICGAESNPTIQPVSTGGGPDSKYCVDDPVLLNPTPAGGTLTILSGPGTLSGNTLSFTGEGTVSVQYSVTASCGGTSVTTRSFDAALCPADLQIAKVADNAAASVGSNIVFTITAKNNGPYKATGVTVNDALPSGYTFVSAVPSAGTWSAPNWTIGSLANGASASLAVTATVNATGSYANTASIIGNNPDNTPGNNSATATPLVQSNLSVVKSINNMSPNVGSNVTFTITASNAGPSAATGVKVTDNLPSGYTFVSASVSSGSWSAPEWNIGNLASGASATLTVVAIVNAGGSYTNTAAVSGLENDPVSGNNSSSVTPTVNHNPTAVADIYTVAEDNTIALTPLTNDTDMDGDALSIVSINGTALTGLAQAIAVPNGTVNISASGAITFTPAANFNSTAPVSFPYVITDGNLTAAADIEITVTAVNDAPVALKDVYTAAEDNAIALTPLANDTDVDGDALSIVSINGTALTGLAQTIAVPNGTVNISASGAITFTPAANFNSTAPVSFPYVITDGNLTAAADIEITVTAVNDAPVAVKDVYTAAEDNEIALAPLANDTDVDGDALSIVSINGTALTGLAQMIAVPNGTVNISASGAITFTPAANFNSTVPVSFPYVITDGNLTAAADIEVTVTAVNDAPVAVKDVYTAAEDNEIALAPLANDTDVDGDALSIVSINGTALTGLAQAIAVPNGTVNISASGAITFTPAANFNSIAPVSFPYVITDGNLTAAADIEITVTAVNDAPVAVKDVYTAAEDNAIALTPLANDTDVDGDALSIVSINGTALTGLAQAIAVPNGTVNISASGAITFTPAANFNSTAPVSFPYVITDGNLTAAADIEITVTAVNDAPVAVKDVYTAAEDNAIALAPLANDTDVDGDALSIVSINGTALTGLAQAIAVPNGTVNISASGAITFTPAANFNSTAPVSFPYVITDGNLTAAADIEITVTAVNDAPVAVKDVYTAAEDNAIALTPLANDTDVDGDALSIVSINGTALTGLAQAIAVPNGTVNISASGAITFTPAANFNSTAPVSFPYVITDGNLTAAADIEITVTAVNDAPVAVKDVYTAAEDNAIALTPLANDTDVDGDALSIVSINGTALTGLAQAIAVPNGTVNISASGAITFTPAANFNSTVPVSFPYVITDGNLTAAADIEITVTAVNDAPVAVNDTNDIISSAAGATIINRLEATDVDGTIANYTVLSLPADGTLALAGNPITLNQVLTPAEAAMISYTPSGTFTGNVVFTFTATDDLGLAALVPATVTIPVGNNAPVANNDTNTAIPSSASATAIKALTATDTDGTIVSYTVVTLPSHGTLILNGTPVAAGQVLTAAEAGMLSYKPNGTFSGNDFFTFTATDNSGASDATPAVITVPS